MRGECSLCRRPLPVITTSLWDTKNHQPDFMSREATVSNFRLPSDFLAALTGCGSGGLKVQEGAQPWQHGGRGSVLAQVLLPLPIGCAAFRHETIVLLWAFCGIWANLPARSQDLQPYESCRARQAVSVFSWIKPRTILFSSELFLGPTTCARLHETTKKVPSPSYLI